MQAIKTIIVFLLLCGSAFATEYYVRTDGNDGNNGLADSAGGAWLTVAYAAGQVSAGTHTINVGNGTYTESQIVLATGVSLTSTSQDNTKVKIQPNADMSTSEPLILLSSAAGTEGSQSISYLEIDGIDGANEAKVGIAVFGRNNVQINNNWIHDFRDNGTGWFTSAIKVMADTTTPGNWYSIIPADRGLPGDDSNLNATWPTSPIEGLKINNNTIDDSGYMPAAEGTTGSGAIVLSNIKDSFIYDNTMDNTGYKTELISGGGPGKEAWLDNVDIYNNTLTYGGTVSGSISWSIEVWCLKGGSAIYNNTATGGFSITIGKETHIYNNSIIGESSTDTQIYGIENPGIFSIVEDNYFENVKYGVQIGTSYKNYNGWIDRNSIVRRNVIVNPAHYGVPAWCISSSGGGTYSTTCSNYYIYNNTILDNNGSATRGRNSVLLFAWKINNNTVTYSDVNVKNNVFIDFNNTTWGYGGSTVETGANVTSVSIDYNLMHGNRVDDWLNDTDTNPILDNPTFVDENGGEYDDYAPASGSNLIDAGTYLTEVNDGDNCSGAGCTAMIVDDVGYFAVGDSVWVDAATDFLEEITAINYSTNTLTLDAAHDHEDGNDVYLAYSSTRGLLGSSVDLGAIEFAMVISDPMPEYGATGIALAGEISWTNPTGYTNVDVYFEKISGACNLEVGDRVYDNQDVSSYDPAGDMVADSDYCWRVDVNHAGGTEVGSTYVFTTTGGGGPAPPGPVVGAIKYSSSAGKILYSSNAGRIGASD